MGIRVIIGKKAARLWSAAHEGNKKMVDLLLAKGVNVNKKTRLGLFIPIPTPLFAAIVHNYDDIVKVLLAHGAEVNGVASDKAGTTPLHHAAAQGFENIVQLLLSKGADVNKERFDGSTALFVAAQQNRKDVVEILLDNGADINKETIDGVTPLFIAAQYNRKDAVEILLARGADVNKARNDGVMPLDIAVQKGNTVIQKMLEQYITLEKQK
jgi:ankyrin repeat protein